ncbi:MAG TPA: nitroreductase [candidate division Zixibacteria bacterium]|nr:nitroreductase [candidate division Zixibacteria bacterium]
MSFKLIDILKNRRSVRKYTDRKVSDSEINIILEAARFAPSSNNTQCWRFVIVRDEEKIRELSKAGPLISKPVIGFIEKAPCVIACCAEPQAIYHKAAQSLIPSDLAVMDVTIATEHIVLSAAEMGLGTCWIGWVSEKKAAKILDLPKKWKVIALLAVGWPEKPLEPREPNRKELSEIAFRETPQNPWKSED